MIQVYWLADRNRQKCSREQQAKLTRKIELETQTRARESVSVTVRSPRIDTIPFSTKISKMLVLPFIKTSKRTTSGGQLKRD